MVLKLEVYYLEVDREEIRMSKKYTLGIILSLIATIAWGGMFPVMAPALKIIDPFYFTLFRYGTVAIIFAILLLIIEGPSSFKPEGHFFNLWLLGSFAFADFNLLVFLGQHAAGESGSLIASVMMAVQPLIGAVVTWIMYKKTPKRITFISMLIAFVGVFLVITKGNPAILFQGHDTLVATGLIFLADLFWVLFTTGGTKYKNWSILRYSTLTTVYGVFTLIIIVVFATLVGWLKVPTTTQVGGIRNALIYMITFAGVIAVFSWNYGNRLLGPVNGILFMNVEPITAFIIMAITGYKVSIFEIIGCVLTIVALVMNNLALRTKKNVSSVNEVEIKIEE